MIEDRRPQRRRDAAQRRQADVDEPGGVLEPIDKVDLFGQGGLPEPHQRRDELEADAGKRLPEIVVQHPGELTALRFPDRLGVDGEVTQTVPRFEPRLLAAHHRGHVDVAPHVRYQRVAAADRHVVASQDAAIGP